MQIEHHIKYKEIHGVDETKWMPMSEHKKLHYRLRKEGKCNISPNILEKISQKANRRTSKYKSFIKEYEKKNIERIHFTERLMPYVVFHEVLKYNNKTGTATWSAFFRATDGKKLYEVNL